jgi:hypothetical protein
MGLLVGCYSPTFPENQPCSETQNCPDGLACDVGTNECVSEVPETARFVTISTYDDNVCGIDPAGALSAGTQQPRRLRLGDLDPRLVPARHRQIRLARREARRVRELRSRAPSAVVLDNLGAPSERS